MPYNSAHHCVVEVENFLFVLGGEDQWNPNGMYAILKDTGSICLPVSVCLSVSLSVESADVVISKCF